jgi:hypothetical protein
MENAKANAHVSYSKYENPPKDETNQKTPRGSVDQTPRESEVPESDNNVPVHL